MPHGHNEQSIDKKNNLARFFIEQRHVAWVSLAVALLWGITGFSKCRNGRPGYSRAPGDDYRALAGNVVRTGRTTGH